MKENQELVKRTEVEGTPFMIITTPDGGSVLTMGKYRISEPMESIEEAQQYAQSKPWTLILCVIMAMVQDEIAQRDENYIANKLNEHANQKKNGKNKKS